MRINSVLFNFLLLIFLGTLIYLYLYINYSTYEGFAFDDSMVTNNQKLIKVVDTSTNIDDTSSAVTIKLTPEDIKRDGSSPLLALTSAVDLTSINNYLNATPNAVLYGNGYYWINIPVVGPKFIYCISDKNFFGGGWMLAMRSIFNSKTFNYNSKHWTYNSTLNASSSEIKKLLPTLLGTPNILTTGNIISPIENFDLSEINNTNNTDTKFKYSSVGKNLYRTTLSVRQNNGNITDTLYVPTQNDINNFNCKLDTFNYFRASEILIIFYVKDDQLYKGGEKANDIGWVWQDKINPNVVGTFIQPTLLELFQYLDSTQQSKIKSTTAKTLTKFKKQGDIKSPIWYSSNPVQGETPINYYGFNYKLGNVGARIGFSFGSASRLTSINGIGLTTNSNSNNDFSAGRGIASSDYKDGDCAPITETYESISFEIYVR